MSKITLTPNASGTGTFTIQSPDSNTNRTFTLPDEDGELSVGGGGGLTADFVASGAIGNGKVVSLKGDGTVTLSEASGQSTPVDTEDEAGYWNVAYDANADKVVVVYRTSSGTGEAMVGTVSGGSITFGTPVVFFSGTLGFHNIAIVYSEDAQKVVVLYTETGTFGRGFARVGTVSGTSISFGTQVELNNGAAAQGIQADYDTNANKLIVGFNQRGSDQTYVMVGTISGTSISFGTGLRPEGTTNYIYLQTIYYDPAAQKFLVTYRQSSVLYARVGTVSGTSVSFGAKSSGLQDSQDIGHSYDPVNQKSIMAYRQLSGAYTGVIRTTTISGTTVSFGTRTTFQYDNVENVRLSYVEDQSKTLLVYGNGGDTYKGTYSLVTLDGDNVNVSDSISFTNERLQYFNMVYNPEVDQHALVYRFYTSPYEGKASLFRVAPDIPIIGIAEADIADTESGPITVLGGINSSQTGLTVDEDYKLDFAVSGGLTVGLTSDNTYIGKALSATQILLKGL